MKTKTSAIAAAIAAAIAVSGLAMALNPVLVQADEAPPVYVGTEVMAPRVQGPVTFVTGGIGQAEASAMKQAAGQYALELEFLQQGTPRDAYLAGVTVRIRDARGWTMLDTQANGPFLLAALPPGRYSVEATHNGAVKYTHVDVYDGQHQHLVFEWA